MKLTSRERARIREWLCKNPDAEDQNKEIEFTSEAGQAIHLTRTTTYNGKWKIRLAYHVDSGMFTGDTSGPIPAYADAKNTKSKKYVMTEKFPKKAKKFVELDPAIWGAAPAFVQALEPTNPSQSIVPVLDSKGIEMDIPIGYYFHNLHWEAFGQFWKMPENVGWKQTVFKDGYTLQWKEDFEPNSDTSGDVGGGGGIPIVALSAPSDSSLGHGDDGSELVDPELSENDPVW